MTHKPSQFGHHPPLKPHLTPGSPWPLCSRHIDLFSVPQVCLIAPITGALHLLFPLPRSLPLIPHFAYWPLSLPLDLISTNRLSETFLTSLRRSSPSPNPNPQTQCGWRFCSCAMWQPCSLHRTEQGHTRELSEGLVRSMSMSSRATGGEPFWPLIHGAYPNSKHMLGNWIHYRCYPHHCHHYYRLIPRETSFLWFTSGACLLL